MALLQQRTSCRENRTGLKAPTLYPRDSEIKAKKLDEDAVAKYMQVTKPTANCSNPHTRTPAHPFLSLTLTIAPPPPAPSFPAGSTVAPKQCRVYFGVHGIVLGDRAGGWRQHDERGILWRVGAGLPAHQWLWLRVRWCKASVKETWRPVKSPHP